MSEIIQQQDTRRTFVDTLNELAKTDDKIIVLIPDVGFNYLSDPNLNFKVINTGVTEQSTTMIAVGLALSGFKPYVYSMINFVLFRPYEMVRNGIVQHKANVKLLGVKGSDSYKFLGFSHNMAHSKMMCKKEENFQRRRVECVCDERSPLNDEDVRTCKNLDLRWFVPTNNEEVQQVILDTYQDEKSAYIRL